MLFEWSSLLLHWWYNLKYAIVKIRRFGTRTFCCCLCSTKPIDSVSVLFFFGMAQIMVEIHFVIFEWLFMIEMKTFTCPKENFLLQPVRAKSYNELIAIALLVIHWSLRSWFLLNDNLKRALTWATRFVDVSGIIVANERAVLFCYLW